MRYVKKVCSFTGLRTHKLSACLKKGGHSLEQLRAALHEEIDSKIQMDFEVFQCGMAIGADILFAEEILRQKQRYPRTQFIAVVPCAGQDARWNAKEKLVYHDILQRADDVVYTSKTTYTSNCMQIRNRYLVDTCDAIIAVHDGQRGGTQNTLAYAKEKHTPIVILDPLRMVRVQLIDKITDYIYS